MANTDAGLSFESSLTQIQTSTGYEQGFLRAYLTYDSEQDRYSVTVLSFSNREHYNPIIERQADLQATNLVEAIEHSFNFAGNPYLEWSQIKKYETVDFKEEAVIIVGISDSDRTLTTKPVKSTTILPNQDEKNTLIGDQNDHLRANKNKPETSELLNKKNGEDVPNNDNPSKEGSSFSQTIEKKINSLEKAINDWFRESELGIELLKKDLEDYTSNGGNPIFAASAATGLDFLGLSIGIAKGTPLGILDVRNVGEGLEEGTWQGVKRDAQRVLSVVPQGKVLKAIDALITIDDIKEQFEAGQYGNGILAAGTSSITKVPKIRVPAKTFVKKNTQWKSQKRGGSYAELEKLKKERKDLYGNEYTEIDHIIPMESYKIAGVLPGGRDDFMYSFLKRNGVGVLVAKDRHRGFISTGSSATAQVSRIECGVLLMEGKFAKAFDYYASKYKKLYSDDRNLSRGLREAKKYYMKELVPVLKDVLSM